MTIHYIIIGLLLFVIYRLFLLGKMFSHLTVLQDATTMTLEILKAASTRLNEITLKVDLIAKKVSKERLLPSDDCAYTQQMKAINDHLQLIFQKLDKKKKNG